VTFNSFLVVDKIEQCSKCFSPSGGRDTTIFGTSGETFESFERSLKLDFVLHTPPTVALEPWFIFEKQKQTNKQDTPTQACQNQTFAGKNHKRPIENLVLECSEKKKKKKKDQTQKKLVSSQPFAVVAHDPQTHHVHQS
jgi:hypothetical protein